VKKGYKRPGNGSKKPRKRDAGPIKGSLPWITLQREKVKLQKEELDLRQRNGELLDADKVRTEAFNMGRSLRDAVLNVPDRLSMILSAENSPEKIHRALTEEFRRIFEAFVSENRSTGTVTI
jgi:hypothetical protein